MFDMFHMHASGKMRRRWVLSDATKKACNEITFTSKEPSWGVATNGKSREIYLCFFSLTLEYRRRYTHTVRNKDASELVAWLTINQGSNVAWNFLKNYMDAAEDSSYN